MIFYHRKAAKHGRYVNFLVVLNFGDIQMIASVAPGALPNLSRLPPIALIDQKRPSVLPRQTVYSFLHPMIHWSQEPIYI